MEALCEELLEGGETAVFLAGIANRIQSKDGHPCEAITEEAAKTLLQDKYRTILSHLGWDLLTLFTPLLCPSYHHSWQLINHIIAVGSPKEMVLALLEQMEALAMNSKELSTFMMLDPLRKVLERVELNGGIVDSTLHSTFNLLKPLLLSTQSRGRRSKRRKRREEPSEDDEEEVKQAKDTDEDDKNDPEEAGAVSKPSSSECDEDSASSPYQIASLKEAVTHTLEFVSPLSEGIHKGYIESGGGAWSWTLRQRECIAMLLSLLDYPLVSKNLSLEGKHAPTAARVMAERIMSVLVRCHCGTMNLLARKREKDSRSSDGDTGDTDEMVSIPAVGTSCFAYLLLCEEMQASYLPLVYSTHFIFSISIHHSHTLLNKQEKNSLIKKGLGLLEALLSRLPDHTLPSQTLEDKTYIEVAQTLVNLMTLSQLKSIRQRSVKLFLQLLSKFDEKGRHRFYRTLIQTVSHSGVKGLLIHEVKNEVERALKTDIKERSLFLNQNLESILKLSMRVDTGMELLKEFDSLMSGLNVLRYLFIRDKRGSNETGVWDMVEWISGEFLSPLRNLLAETKVHCRNECHRKEEEEKEMKAGGDRTSKNEEEPDVTICVPGGENLPEPTLQDDIQMLKVALQQMDMMESVLVRVEELMT